MAERALELGPYDAACGTFPSLGCWEWIPLALRMLPPNGFRIRKAQHDLEEAPSADKRLAVRTFFGSPLPPAPPAIPAGMGGPAH